MRRFLCKTDRFEYKSFIKGNEYFVEYEELVGSFKVYNELGDYSWFSEEELDYFFTEYTR